MKHSRALTAVALFAALPGCKKSEPNEDVRVAAVEPAAEEEKQTSPPAECQSECITPFGDALGEHAGVIGYSNCRPECIDPTPMEVSDTYTGIKWQCVEYARRWWLIKRNAVFGSVDTADDMWTVLSNAERPGTKESVPLERRANGGREAPAVGDLLIYKKDANTRNLTFGHVAVVVSVDEDAIAVAEQNYDNRGWKNPKEFARRLTLKSIDGRFTVYDEAPSKTPSDASAERIYGWLHLVE